MPKGVYKHSPEHNAKLGAVLKGRAPHNRLAFGIGSRNNLYQQYARIARIRLHEFSLSLEQAVMLFQSPCHYCGQPPTRIHHPVSRGKRAHGHFTYNGIDRKDNNLGYTSDNSVSCCFTCNRAKHTMTYQQFMNYLDGLVAWRLRKQEEIA